MGRVVSWQFCGSEPRRHVTNTLCCACDSLRVRVNNQCRYEPLCALLEFISRRTSAGTCHLRCAPPPCRGNLVTGHPGNDRRDFLAPAAGGHMAKVQCWRVLCRNHRHCCKWKAHPVTQAVVVVGWSRARDVYVAVVVVVVVAARGRQAAWSTAARAWRHRRSCCESSGARNWASRSARSIPRDHDDLGRRARERALDVSGTYVAVVVVVVLAVRGRQAAWSTAARAW